MAAHTRKVGEVAKCLEGEDGGMVTHTIGERAAGDSDTQRDDMNYNEISIRTTLELKLIPGCVGSKLVDTFGANPGV